MEDIYIEHKGTLYNRYEFCIGERIDEKENSKRLREREKGRLTVLTPDEFYNLPNKFKNISRK